MNLFGTAAPSARTLRTSAMALALAGFMISGFGERAHAQFVPPSPASSTAFQVDPFEPLPAQGLNILNIGTSEVLGHLKPSFGLFLHYADDLLEISTSANPGDPILHLVEGQLKAELSAAMGFFGVVDVGIVMPLVLFGFGEGLGIFGRSGETVDGFAAGDLRLIPRIQLIDPEWDWSEGFGLAVMASIYFPTGNQERFAGDGDFRVMPRLILDWRHSSGFTIALNAGYHVRPERRAHDYISDDQVRLGAGVEIPTGIENFQIIGTVAGSVPVMEGRDPSDLAKTASNGKGFPVEADAALQYRIAAADLVVNAGAGFGLTRSVGSPDWRVFASLSYTPTDGDKDGDGILDSDDSCPEIPEDMDAFEDTDGCPEADNDGDGVLDTDDGPADDTGFGSCRDQPEDRDAFEDADGCPDEDNDGDGILDIFDGVKDASGSGNCRNQPEDFDNYQDDDGCPDLDNDGDGVLDVDDGAKDDKGFGSCRDQAEDFDRFQDADGCPDPDNDGDGILDINDGEADETGFGICRDNPENFNDFEDEDGCPDTTAEDVEMHGNRIVILKKVYFNVNKDIIKRKSYAILNSVAKTLMENPSITGVRIEGHTDSDGGDAANEDLSQRRAASVVNYLVKAGVEKSRLTPVGFGERRPVDTNSTREGKTNNRRVEFHITEVNGKAVEDTTTHQVEDPAANGGE